MGTGSSRHRCVLAISDFVNQQDDVRSFGICSYVAISFVIKHFNWGLLLNCISIYASLLASTRAFPRAFP